MALTELGFVYYLQNPQTAEIFYVGSTQVSIKNRLRTHYQHLKEFEKGLRKSNKRYEYLQKLRPYKAEIHLLEIVTNADLDEREIYYINFFRTVNPNLTNMTEGGRGGCINKYYTEKELEQLSTKISLANKGRKKPEFFSKNLSVTRTGLGNPAAKELVNWIISFKDGTPEKLFKYGFEINQLIGNKHAYGNVHKAMKDKTYNPYKRIWMFFNSCSKNIQDIVLFDYESNQT